jgi:hypothetical protein
VSKDETASSQNLLDGLFNEISFLYAGFLWGT